MAKYTAADGRRLAVRTTSRTGHTRTACRELLRFATHQAAQNVRPVSGRLTVAAWLDAWLADYVIGGVAPKAPRTQESYESVVRVHLKPRLGSVVLAKLTREDVSRALSALQADGMKPSMVDLVRTVLGVAIDEAWKSDKVLQNVVRKTERPKPAREEIVPWSAGEAGRFLASLRGDRYEALFSFILGTGLREGEALGVRWADLDQPNESATVLELTRQLTRDGVLADLKTRASRRKVSLNNDLARAGLKLARLQQARDRFAGGGHWSNPAGYVFTRPNGSPLHHRVVWNAFRSRVARCEGLPPITVHGLRHTFASMMLTEGIPLEVISKMLGHGGLEVTLRVYAHLDPKRAAVAAARIDGALSDAMRRRMLEAAAVAQ